MESQGYKVQTGFGLGYTNAKGVKIGSKDLGEGYKKTEVDSRIETGRLSREQERQASLKLQLQRGIEERQRIAEVQEKERLKELAQEQEREAIQREKTAEEKVKKEKQKEQVQPIPMFPKQGGGIRM